MARPLRILFAGAWYHVMNRGLERREIFRGRIDCEDFLRLLNEIHDRFRVEIHAYCLMGNHYHLVLRTPSPNLPRAMRHLDGVYTQRFNARHGRDGPMFRGRYRAILVQADRHLVCAARYAHLNPVEAGLVQRPEDWPHSSYRAYLNPGRRPPWLRTEVVLGWFGTVGGRQRHRAFTEEGVDRSTREFFERARVPPVFGDDVYRDEMANRFANATMHPEMPDGRLVRPARSLHRIARTVAGAFGVSVDELRAVGSCRSRAASIARGAFIQVAVRHARYPMRVACGWLGYAGTSSGFAAMRRLTRTIRVDDDARRSFELATSRSDLTPIRS